MTQLLISVILVSFYCNTLTATIVHTQNAFDYNTIYIQFQQFAQNFVQTNFNGLNFSDNCNKELSAYANGLNATFHGDVQLWAVKMLDAMGKLEPGILDLNSYSLGSFDECLSIKNEIVLYKEETLVISGKYCVANFGFPPKDGSSKSRESLLLLGICLPSSCNAFELNQLSSFIYGYDDLYCQVNEDSTNLSAGDITVIVFLSLVGLIAIISTICDAYLRSVNEKKPNSIYLSFSLLSNGEKLFATGTSSDQLGCLSGIRTLSMMWIILSHMFNAITLKPVSNLSYMQQFYTDGWTMYIRGASVSVDSFFLMSGIVLIYVYLKTLKTQKTNFNIFSYYLHRYLRLTPALAVVILIQVTLLRHFGSGPMWPMMNIIDCCDTNWWIDLIYMQNFIDYKNVCLGQSWYLAVDTQLFLLSPLILIPLRRWRKQTLAGVAVAASASIASSFAFAWTMELHNSNSKLNTVTSEMALDYMYYYYTAPYNRASPWLIGIIVGYFIYQIKVEKTKFKFNPVHNIVLWMSALAVLGTCVFYDSAQYDYERTSVSFYIAFLRPAWAIALSWVIVACVTEHGGVVNWFLSLPIFHVLGRLTYSLYLIHGSIILSIHLSQKNTVVLSNVAVMYEFWSVYALCLGVAIIWTLLFESPIIVIEKSLKSKAK